MTDLLARLVVWLNSAANALGSWVLAPLAFLPGWLSVTLVAVATGLLLLVAFKYTSKQRAIKRVRDDLDASLLALKLFKESTRATIQSQGRLLLGAGKLLVLALVPTAIMALPVTLVLGQLSLWYQQRPLTVAEEAVVTLTLNGDSQAPLPRVQLRPTEAVEATVGPIRVLSKREVCWSLNTRKAGYHLLTFQVGDLTVDKELAVGDGFLRVSPKRPSLAWSDALRYPWEQPFPPDSPVKSIEIAYPPRESRIYGSDWWVLYWFAISLATAFCCRRLLGVNV